MLVARKNVSYHFTPTCSSWAKLTEAFFGKLPRQALKAGDLESVEDMCRAKKACVKVHNKSGIP